MHQHQPLASLVCKPQANRDGEPFDGSCPDIQLVSDLVDARSMTAAALGLALIPDLVKDHAVGIYYDPPKLSKEERAEAVMHLVNAGRIALPEKDFYGTAFLKVLEEELFAFPGAPHDDQVDALVLGLWFLASNGFGKFAPLRYCKKPSLEAYPHA